MQGAGGPGGGQVVGGVPCAHGREEGPRTGMKRQGLQITLAILKPDLCMRAVARKVSVGMVRILLTFMILWARL